MQEEDCQRKLGQTEQKFREVLKALEDFHYPYDEDLRSMRGIGDGLTWNSAKEARDEEPTNFSNSAGNGFRTYVIPEIPSLAQASPIGTRIAVRNQEGQAWPDHNRRRSCNPGFPEEIRGAIRLREHWPITP